MRHKIMQIVFITSTNCNNIAFQNCAEVKFDKETGEVPHMNICSYQSFKVYFTNSHEIQQTFNALLLFSVLNEQILLNHFWYLTGSCFHTESVKTTND